jgi:hypothetical protein
MKILKFQSKPVKPKKFIYTLQKNGMYKSNGPRGNEYSLANFNNLNPVLEVEHNGVVFKKDLVLVGIGKVVSMAMTLTRDNVVITGNAKSIASRTVLATNAKIDEPVFDFVKATKLVLDSVVETITDSTGDSTTQDSLTTCCGLTEVGEFATNYHVKAGVQDVISSLKDKPSKEDSKKLYDFVLSKAAEKYLLESVPMKQSFVAVLNNKDQSLVLEAFQSLDKAEFKNKLVLTPFKSNTTKNNLTLITYLL